MLTLRRVLAAWTIFVGCRLVRPRGMAAEQEEDCRASGNFFCTADPGSVFLFVGFWVAAASFIGTVVIVYVWSLVVGLKKRWWLYPLLIPP